MKRLVLLFACFVAGVCFVVVPSIAIADKPPTPPGQGECNHGNSNQPCKPDPQPEHGKDCDPHGNNGGVNEDHCLSTTTGSTTTTTNSTTDTTTTNQTTTKETTSTRTETTPQTTSTPMGTSGQNTTSVESTTSSSEGTTTSVTPLPTPKCDDGSNPPCPTPDAAPPLQHKVKAQTASAVKGELPYTGISLLLVGFIGLLMMSTGIYLRRGSNE